jgi:arylsulfatase A-like enzyme
MHRQFPSVVSTCKSMGATALRRLVRPVVFDAYYEHVAGGRCDVVSEDWDNLVVLDACRYDHFREESDLSGELSYRISRGGVTGEFLEANFGDSEYSDVVYVTANPHVDRLLDGRFHDIVSVWQTGWSEEYRTVLPETMVEATLDALERYPDKRIVSHFMQPHQPFVGERAQERIGSLSGNVAAKREALGEIEDGPDRDELPNVWSLMRRGELSREDVVDGYRENLSLVLDAVADLIEALKGKTVVTADHGEMFGGFAWPVPLRVYGHSTIVHPPKLVKVPWLEVPTENRRPITDGRIAAAGSDAEDEISQKLQQLGYLDG